jgi:hypothetical protein
VIVLRRAVLAFLVAAVVVVFGVEMCVHSIPQIESLDISMHVATLVAVIVGIVWIGAKIDVLHVLVNSRMSGILELQASKSFAEGVKSEQDRDIKS